MSHLFINLTLEIKFVTHSINKNLYKRAIQSFLYDTMGYWHKGFDDWVVTVISNNLIEDSEYFDGDKSKGVGGVTGGGHVKLWIEDTDNDMIFMSNMMMISHELSHMIGMVLNWRERVPLRNADWSGHTKGTVLNNWTQEIHDRHVEGNLRPLKFWYRRRWFWRRMNCIVLNIKDIA